MRLCTHPSSGRDGGHGLLQHQQSCGKQEEGPDPTEGSSQPISEAPLMPLGFGQPQVLTWAHFLLMVFFVSYHYFNIVCVSTTPVSAKM